MSRRLLDQRHEDRRGADRALARRVADEAQRALWLPGAPLRLRTATAPKSARLDWGDGDGTTRVSACFLPTGDAKSTVGLMHECLAGAAEAERMKAFWRGRFVTLKQVLER